MPDVHLCIDVQDGQAGRLVNDRPDFFHRLKKTIAAFDAVGIPTVFVVVDPEGRLKGTPEFGRLGQMRDGLRDCLSKEEQLASELSLDENALIAVKHTYSAHTNQALMDHLERQGADKVYLSGLWETNRGDDPGEYLDRSCVSSTADHLNRAGYKPVIVADATNRHFDSRLTLPQRQEIHRQAGAQVLPLADITDDFALSGQPKKARSLGLRELRAAVARTQGGTADAKDPDKKAPGRQRARTPRFNPGSP